MPQLAHPLARPYRRLSAAGLSVARRSAPRLLVVRQRLRGQLGRPASSGIVGWAVLCAIVCGLFTAAIAARAGWQTSRPQPDRAEAAAIFSTVLPDHKLGDISTAPALFVIYGAPLSRHNVDTLFFGDGGEYQLSEVAADATGTAAVDQQDTLATAQQRLRATGWRVYRPVVSNMADCGGPPCDPSTLPQQTELTARRGDTILELDLAQDSTVDTRVSLHRTTPPAAALAAIAGGLLGAIAGWLLFGWASRRTNERGPALRTAATALYSTTMVLWWLPILPATAFTLRDHAGPQWPQLWEWLGQPTASLLFLSGCGTALLGLALAVPRQPNSGRAPAIVPS